MMRFWSSQVLLFGLYVLAALANAGGNPSEEVVTSTTVDFWNGNKTGSRQTYERQVLDAALAATEADYGPWQVQESRADYPKAEDEAAVFRGKGHDLFVTVAGNKKLAKEKKILLPQPLMKGLLGYRILIIRQDDAERFAEIDSAEGLKPLRMGIPETWADADLFRHNGYTVVERGDFDSLFERLAAGEIDYVAFGANEVEGVFSERAQPVGDLAIEPSLLLYYPFPLVFYVAPDEPELAKRLETGLQRIQDSGQLQEIFTRHNGDVVQALDLHQRQLIKLQNPILPSSMTGMSPDLVKP